MEDIECAFTPSEIDDIQKSIRREDVAAIAPLVNPDRQHAIQKFFIALRELEHQSGLVLDVIDGGIVIRDKREPLPEGYLFAASIRENGTLEMTTWVAP